MMRKGVHKISKEQHKRILKSKRDFRKLQEEIAPFIRRKEFKVGSTAGKWSEVSPSHPVS
jgi:hypothetical protein